MTDTIDIAGLDKAAVLAALWNNAAPPPATAPVFIERRTQAMTLAEAGAILEHDTSFDYLHGRILKIDLGDDSFRGWLYDRDNGADIAQRVVDHLRHGGDPTARVAQ